MPKFLRRPQPLINSSTMNFSSLASSDCDFMTDPRLTKLAKPLVEYSTVLKPGDRVLLDMIDVPDEFSIELIRAARAASAIPIVEVRHTRVTRELLRDTDADHAQFVRDLELARMKKV